jgi:hypothetical protein
VDEQPARITTRNSHSERNTSSPARPTTWATMPSTANGTISATQRSIVVMSSNSVVTTGWMNLMPGEPRSFSFRSAAPQRMASSTSEMMLFFASGSTTLSGT